MCTPLPFPVGLSSLLQMCENTCEDCGRQFNDTATCRCKVCIQIAQIFHLWRSSNLNDGYFQVVQVDILRRLHVLIDLVHQSSTTRCAEAEALSGVLEVASATRRWYGGVCTNG